MILLKKILQKIRIIIWRILYASSFDRVGKKSFIFSPLKLQGKKNISIGDRVTISRHAWLMALPLGEQKKSRLVIENGCTIGHFNHISTIGEMIIEENVLTADKVYISDNLHAYSDVDVPIMFQPILYRGPVRIGRNSWIGENVCIIGVSIGKHCIVGANSVVTKNLPDYSVAVGNPAKVIKRYSPETKKWQKTDSSGNFLAI